MAAFQNHWRNIQLAIKNKQAQLDALQSRIQPHFLFNALNSLAALIHTEPAKAETLLLNLSDLFRATLSGNTEVSLATELENTKHYLDIEKMRYGDRMLVEWQLPEQLPDIVLPALCLQPLAENAVKHGIDPSIKGGSICISIQNQSNQVLIRISNTLPDGLQLPTNEGFNIGLRTTIERIALMSDGGNQLKTYLRNGQFVAEITVRNTV